MYPSLGTPVLGHSVREPLMLEKQSRARKMRIFA